MSATLNEHTSMGSMITPDVTRVAIREVREVTFRALVAAGSSSAEAKVAAEQVLFAELHRGVGLAALLEELAVGPWVSVGLGCERDLSGQRPVLRVSGPGGTGALRQGALLLDLLAAEPDPDVVVVSDGLTSLSPFLDEPMIRAARATGVWIVAVDHSASSSALRTAAPDGSIGCGTTGPPSQSHMDLQEPPHGVSLHRHEGLPVADLVWLTAEEQRVTRADAAQQGQLVDSAVWAAVTTAARAYLVSEQ